MADDDLLITYKKQEYAPLPVNTYLAEITGVKAKKGTYGTYLTLELTVLKDSAGNEKHKGKKAWKNASLTNAFWAFFINVTGGGLPEEGSPVDVSKLKSKRIYFTVTRHQKSESGSVYPEVGNLIPESQFGDVEELKPQGTYGAPPIEKPFTSAVEEIDLKDIPF